MKINYIFKKLFLIIGLLSFLITPNKCWAGGILYLYDGQKWNLQNFSEESYISYQNGLQKLILNINFYQEKSSAQKGFIIFPLPCSLNDAKLSSINGKPNLFAGNVKNTILYKIMDFEIMSDIFSGFFSALYTPIMQFTLFSSDGGHKRSSHYPRYIKQVNYVILTELVKYDKLNEFKSYLLKKSIYLDEKFDEIIDSYINNKFTFALVYLSLPEVINEKNNFSGFISEIQLYVKFKSNKIYYPLKIASIYKNVIKNTLYIFGFKTPELYPEISKNTTINYYSGDNFNINDNFKEFFPNNFVNYKWTGLEIETNAKNLIKDLSINDDIPNEAMFLSSFFQFIYLPISSIVYIIMAFIVYYLLFLFFCYKNMPDKKFILFLSISFYLSHLFTFIYSYIIKLDEKICNEQNDELDIEGKTNSKIQNKMFITLIVAYLSIISYYYVYYSNITQSRCLDSLFAIIVLLYILNRFFNTILLNFYILFYVSFVILNSIYHYYIYNFIKSFLYQ